MLKRATIVDVAREAGVAVSTASAALNGRAGVAPDTRERVERAASKLGFVASLRGRSLSTRRTFSIGLVVERDSSVLEGDPFFWGFVAGIEDVLDPRGYALVLHLASSPAHTQRRIESLCLSRGVDGMLLTGVQVHDDRFDLVRRLGVAAVAVGGPLGVPGVSTVRQPDDEAVRALARLLIDQGHRRIAHIAGPLESVHGEERLRLWREEMTAAGLPTDLVEVGDFTMNSGGHATEALMSRPTPPTALMCATDLMAVGALLALRHRGLRVPEDISVTGFDGVALSDLVTPGLTTAQTSAHTLGMRAAELLLDRIDGGERTDVVIEPSQIVVRDSVAPPPGAGLL